MSTSAQWPSMISMVRPNIGFYSHEVRDSASFQRLLTRLKMNAQWVYPCKDGWVSFNAGTDRFWRGAKKALGHPEWMETELFNTVLGRAANIDAIEAGVVDWLSTQTRVEAFEKAQAEHVPCFPVHSPAEVAGNEQYKARRFFVDVDHSAAREVRMPGAPCKFSRTPWRVVRGAPRLGEHNSKRYFAEAGRQRGKVGAAGRSKRVAEKAAVGNSDCGFWMDLRRSACDSVAGGSGSRRDQNRVDRLRLTWCDF